MKTLLIASLIALQMILMSSSAYADEDSWLNVSLKLPSLQNEIVGYKTDDGSFRLAETRPALSNIEISGGIFKADPKKAEVRCKGYGKALRTSKTILNNVYQFKAFIYPLAAAELKRIKSSIQNAPKVQAIEVKLNPVSNDSIVTPLARQQFEERLAKEIWDQIDSVQENGELTVDLEQVDDVACDLILSQAQLEVRFGLYLELAKHDREVVISAQDFERVYENLRTKSVSTKVTSQIHLVNGAMLNAALMKEAGKALEDMPEKNFLRISQAIFNTDTGSLNNYARTQYAQVARSLDNLKIYSTSIPLSVRLKAQAVEAP